jgi:hypothetical protein
MEGYADTGALSTVNVQSVIHQQTASLEGGPQAFEGYTLIEHDRGTVNIAIGTIGNVEQNGAGEVNDIRSMQAGGVVTGPGRVHHWAGLSISAPRARSDYKGAVNIERYDYVDFDNGWSIRPDGKRLLICDPKNICRPL